MRQDSLVAPRKDQGKCHRKYHRHGIDMLLAWQVGMKQEKMPRKARSGFKPMWPRDIRGASWKFKQEDGLQGIQVRPWPASLPLLAAHLHPTGGCPGGSDGKESACNAGDPGSTLGQENPLEEEMATHFSILAWEIPWTEEPGRLQSTQSQRGEHDWTTSTYLHPKGSSTH